MMKLDVEFYDGTHRGSLKANCSKYDQLDRLVQSGLDVEAEELFSYSMFVEQRSTVTGWQTYRDLVTHLPAFREVWEHQFACSAGTIHATRETGTISTYHKEALGVGGALSVVSRAYGLTEADWEAIPAEPPLRILDFKIASTGSGFVEVEAKGSVVPDYHKSHLSKAKDRIEEKKRAQRAAGNVHTMIGVITAIPSDSSLRTKCFLLDPPPVEIPFDAFKYKLLARLCFYWRELRLVSRAHFLEVLANRIESILRVSDYRSLDGLPLLNIYGERHQVPVSLFETRSSVRGKSAFGEALPFGDGRFLFYGFDTDVVEPILAQDYGRLIALSFQSRVETRVKVSAKIPKRLLEGPGQTIEYGEEDEGENRKTMPMVGDLTHTPCGRVLGYLEPFDRKSSHE